MLPLRMIWDFMLINSLEGQFPSLNSTHTPSWKLQKSLQEKISESNTAWFGLMTTVHYRFGTWLLYRTLWMSCRHTLYQWLIHSIAVDILREVWEEFDCQLDVCRAIGWSHIGHLWTFRCKLDIITIIFHFEANLYYLF